MSEREKFYTHPDWSIREVPPSTRCKHGQGDCDKCGNTNRRDVIHARRTPDKRTARRQRRKGGKPRG